MKLGISDAVLFGTEPPYPNPHNFPENECGVPIVPDSAVVSAESFNTNSPVFHGELIYAGDASTNSFQVRRDMGAPMLREGDLFAYENADSNRPALVYEVVKVSTPKGLTVYT